jgi:hypothetical protein
VGSNPTVLTEAGVTACLPMSPRGPVEWPPLSHSGDRGFESRRGYSMARCVRRCGLSFKQAPMGSTPIRATDGRVAEWQTPCAQNAVSPVDVPVQVRLRLLLDVCPRSVAEARDRAKVADQVRLLTRILRGRGSSSWLRSAPVKRRLWVRLPPLALVRCRGWTARRSAATRSEAGSTPAGISG